jgi:ribokinase
MESTPTEAASGRITVIGSYIVALVMDVDRIPLEGETVVGRNYHTTHGGKGSNMAAAAARLGANVRFLGKIGRDDFGQGFLRLLERERVRADGVLVSERLPTATGFILFSSRGTNLIVIDPAACGDFRCEDVEAHAAFIDDAEVVLSPLEIPLATALTGARLAAARGKKAVLNPAPACDLRGADLRCLHALTPNENEARVCLGLPPDDAINDQESARRLLELGPKHVIMTLGERGVLWASQDGTLTRVPALPVDVVDTTGAGDAFNAGLAVGLAEGKSMLQSIAIGVTAASLSTQKRETIESYPYRDAVDARVREVSGRVSS